jgi:hypothetical protein
VDLSSIAFESTETHAQNYASTDTDFNATFDSMWRRKTILEYSLRLSFLATVFAITLPLRFLNGPLGQQLGTVKIVVARR